MATALKDARMRASEFWRTTWCINPELGVTKEDMLKPEYWAHVASKLKPWDLIEARAEDGSYFAVLVVLDGAKTWAKVDEILYKEFKDNAGPADVNVDDKYTIQYKGPHAKWRVTRKSDNNIMREELVSKAAAMAWLSEYQKAL